MFEIENILIGPVGLVLFAVSALVVRYRLRAAYERPLHVIPGQPPPSRTDCNGQQRRRQPDLSAMRSPTTRIPSGICGS